MAIDGNFLRLSRRLRRKQTPWEKKLWAHLKNRRFFGLKFKRQVVIGSYIVDLSCFEQKLVIELDGSGHTEEIARRRDKKRTHFLEDRGYKVLRFGNNDIQDNLEGVLGAIRLAINQ